MDQNSGAGEQPASSDKARKRKPSEAYKVAKEIAAKLGETASSPIRQISVLVRHYGPEYARALLHETLRVEKQGGLLVSDGQRRRTPGGVYFYLAKSRMTDDERRQLLPNQYERVKAARARPRPVFNWDARGALVAPLLARQGAVDTVKITLIGRPGEVTTVDETVITAMTHTASAPTLPRGVPAPPLTPTVYTVYLASKHWAKVQPALAADPDDALIIEGLCAYDSELGAVAVFAMSATTKNLDAAKRQAQKQPPTDGSAPAAAPAPPKKKAPERPAPTPPAAVTLPPIVDRMAPDDAQKLRELYASAALFRQKIETIEARPEGQRFGLEMTRKLLHNLEADIAALEGSYSDSAG